MAYPMFQALHFEVIAQIFSRSKPLHQEFQSKSNYEIAIGSWSRSVHFAANEFCHWNADFDRQRFVIACGVPE